MNAPVEEAQKTEAVSETPTEDSRPLHETFKLGPNELYPSEYVRNVTFRYLCALKAQKSNENKILLLSLSKSNILFWVNTFVYTYDPRKTPSVIPFITYKYEDELLLELVDRIQNQKDILIEKSRDMGVTWCVVLAFTWFWLFRGEGFDFLVGSRKEQYIDVMGNMDTIMEKMRFIIRTMPKWMRPVGWDQKTHSNYMKIVNPETKATVTGEATNNNFSRGGRRRAIFFDEFAFWECDQAAWRASADATNCRIVVSTPNGYNNQFSKLRHSGSIDVKTLHWRLHPEKDQAWYENEKRRRNNDSVEIARELDIDYAGSEEGILFPFNDLKQAVHNKPIMSQDRVVVSVDPSGEGDDEAVIYVSNNGNIVERKFLAKPQPMELAAELVSMVNKNKAQVLIGDAIGNDILAIATNLLGKNERGVKVVQFKSSEKAKDPIKYYNRRAEVYHKASIMLKSGNVQIDDDYTLQKQLNATKYKTKDGRLIVIPKEEIKEMLGTSPDRADAWVLTVEGLSYTHSRLEIEQKERYRNRNFQTAEVESGREYGDWGDLVE